MIDEGDANSRDGGQEHPMVGQVLSDRYRIDALLGEGGMGAVFRATHLSLERPVAVKVLHPRLTDDEHVSKRFDREALAVSKLDHPGCVQVVDFGTTRKGMKYLVMQFLDGRELRDLTGFAMSVEEVVDIGVQIFRALGHAHKRGLVHRDLKPENIFLVTDDDGKTVVKLVDFGIVKLLSTPGMEQLTRKGMAFGTPTYMSPEQAAGGTIDPRTDLYAVGVLLYELLTGMPPFDADEPGILLRMHILADPPPLPDTVPQALADVVLKLLEKEADDRYQTAREARLALVEAAKAPVSLEASIPPLVAASPDAATEPAAIATAAERGAEAPTDPEAALETSVEAAVAAVESPVPVRSGGTVVAGSSTSGAAAMPMVAGAPGVAPHGPAAAVSASHGGAMGHASMSGVGHGVPGQSSAAGMVVDPRAASSAHHPVNPAVAASGAYAMSGSYSASGAYRPGAAPAPRKGRRGMVVLVVVLLVLTWAAIALVWYSLRDDDRRPPLAPNPAAEGIYRFTDAEDEAGAAETDTAAVSPNSAASGESETEPRWTPSTRRAPTPIKGKGKGKKGKKDKKEKKGGDR